VGGGQQQTSRLVLTHKSCPRVGALVGCGEGVEDLKMPIIVHTMLVRV
jgi:hypothetical protein